MSEKSLRTSIGKFWYRKKYRYRYRRNLVPEKSIGIGIAYNFGYRQTLRLILFKVHVLFLEWGQNSYQTLNGDISASRGARDELKNGKFSEFNTITNRNMSSCLRQLQMEEKRS